MRRTFVDRGNKRFKNFFYLRCTRVYWSTNDARRRTVYTCRVIEVHPSECNETQITMKVSKLLMLLITNDLCVMFTVSTIFDLYDLIECHLIFRSFFWFHRLTFCKALVSCPTCCRTRLSFTIRLILTTVNKPRFNCDSCPCLLEAAGTRRRTLHCSLLFPTRHTRQCFQVKTKVVS